ncbi:MAG TPA: hypothetical protein VGK19_11425 [Capsulimonadaceae bacterium]|jgi:fibronectin type 3 domain-containing protein
MPLPSLSLPLRLSLVFALAALSVCGALAAIPTGLTAAPGSATVKLDWASSGDTSYIVKRATSSGGPFEVVASPTTNTYSDAGVINGTTYYYVVSGKTGDVESANSDPATATPSALVPLAPAWIKATVTGSSVAVSWAAVPNATGYKVQRSGTSGYVVNGDNVTSYADSGRANGSYTYTVTSGSAGGYVNSIATTVTVGGTAPAAPSMVYAYPATNGASIYFAPVSGATSYLLYRSTTQGGEGESPVQSATGTFTDANLAGGTTYYYQVSAVGPGGEGPKSTECSTTTGSAVLSAPAWLTAVAGSGQATLNWAPVPEATSYIITNGSQQPITTTAVTNYTATGLTNGTQYRYYVRSVNSSGVGNAVTVLVTPGSTLAAPATLNQSPGNQTVALSWSAVTGATSYYVYESTTPGGEGFNRILTTTATSWTHTALTNGVTHYYQVSAATALTESSRTTEVSSTPTASLPVVPASLNAKVTGTTVTLNWSATGQTATYNVQRGSASGGPFTTIATGLTASTYDDAGLASQAWYYRVCGVNSNGSGAYATTSATVGSTALAAPTDLTPTAGNAQIALNWTTVSGASSYNIYMSTTSGMQGAVPVKTLVTALPYTVSGLANAVTYYFKVAAVNTTGEGALSTEASAAPTALIPQGVAVLTAVPGNGTVTLYWSPVPSATSYRIVRTASGQATATFGGLTGTSYTDTTPTNGIAYTYTINSVLGVNLGTAATAYATPGASPAVPAAPTSLTVSPASTLVQLRWLLSAGATTYHVYRSTTSGGEGSVPYATGGAGAYSDYFLTPGTTYYYKVSASNAAGEGPLSDEISIKVGELVLPAVTNLTAAGQYGKVIVGWTAIAEADQYGVFRTPSSSTPIAFVTGSQYTDTNVVNGTSYTYSVHPYRDGIDTASTSGNRAATPTASPVPTNLTATHGDGTVTLGWDPSAGATSYKVYRSTSSTTETYYDSASTTSYTDTAVTNGTAYFYKVSAVNPGGDSGLSTEATATPLAIPAKPVVTATGGTQKIDLGWDGVVGASTYNVFRGTTPGGESPNPINPAPLQAPGYCDSPLADGTTYYYTVRAANIAGELGPISDEVSAVTAPATPTGLTATHGDAKVDLHWDQVTGATSYKVYRSTTTTTETYFAPAPTFTYSDTAVTNGTAYFYKVSAVNTGGESATGSEASATPLAIPGKPVVTATGGSQKIDLGWDGVVGASTYNVFRGTTTGGESPTPINPAPLATPGYSDSPLADGTTYYYTVRAANIAGELGPISDEVSAVTAPATPTGLTATHGDGIVDLHWDQVTGATSYKVYRSTTTTTETYFASAPTFTYSDTAVTNGTAYFYKVSAVNTGGESGLSTEASTTTPCSVPTAVTATPSVNGEAVRVTLGWGTVSGAASYMWERSAVSAAGPWTQTSTGIAAPPVNDDTVTFASQYWYRVGAVNSAGEVTKSSPVAVTTMPAKPTGLTATPGDGKVTLGWAEVTGATGYKVYRSTSTETEQYLAAAPTYAYTDTSVTNGTTYWYSVSAVNPGGEGAVSAEVSATPQVAAPGAPTGLHATGGIQKIDLGWDAVAGATSYTVYRGTGPNSEDLAEPVGSDLTSAAFTDTAVNTNQYYYYKVTASNLGGESLLSSEADAMAVPPAPTAPYILSATGGDGSVTLTWSEPAYATAYDIMRGTTSGGQGTNPVSPNRTDFACTDSGLTNGTPYYYKVVAKNDTGSATSTEVVVTPYAAPSNVTVIGGDRVALVQWSPVAGATGGGYIVSRGPTSSGPWTQINGRLVVGTAYLDDNTGSGLVNGDPYYYVVRYLDASGQLSPQSAESSATIAAPPGWWGLSVQSSGTSPGTTGNATAYASATNRRTSISAAAGVAGPQSADNAQAATSTATGTWTATWVGNTNTAYPGLCVLDETRTKNASVAVNGTGYSALVTSGTTTLLAAQDPTGLDELPGTPTVTATIDTSEAGHIAFSYDRVTDKRTITRDANDVATGMTEAINNTTHIVHVYLPSYFTAHFTDPKLCSIVFTPPPLDLTASASLTAGALTGTSATASGSISDAFAKYGLWSNN